ncbi:MAG TPA: nuclear transport factor 2 family protein [Bryobacteraceae bacterium]|nr:nuclear transport factor 2 family protein [Bryobacteraceae bacterium]
MTPHDAVLAFLSAINQRDADRLAERLTEDHEFIDSLGNQVRGREKMRAGWRGYYSLCPDYWVAHEHILAEGNVVAVFGTAGGTIAGQSWRTPAAWLATVEDGLVSQWRVYADNKPVYDILAQTAK